MKLVVDFFVDDMIVMGDGNNSVSEFINQLNSKFELKRITLNNNGSGDILRTDVK